MNILHRRIYPVFLALLLFFTCCRKEAALEQAAGRQIEWLRVLNDTTIIRPPKVVTDKQDNIYVSFESEGPLTVIIKHSPLGAELWRKTIKNSGLLDMAVMNNNSIVLSLYTKPESPLGLKLVSISPDGNLSEAYLKPAVPDQTTYFVTTAAYLTALQDGSLLISGGTHVNENHIIYPFAAKLNQSLTGPPEWNRAYVFFNTAVPDIQYQHVVPTNDGYLFQFTVEHDGNLAMNIYYGYITGTLNPDGTIKNYKYTQTGSHSLITGIKKGWRNTYGNLLADGKGGFISWRSLLSTIGTTGPQRPHQFIRFSPDGIEKDSIEFQMPANHYANSITFSKDQKFYMTTNLNGGLFGGAEFTPQQTSFSYGDGINLTKNGSFSLQDQYLDFFGSITTNTEGNFIAAGLLQGDQQLYFQPVLVKLKKP